MNRREVVRHGFQTLCGFALFQTLYTKGLLANSPDRFREWAAALDSLGEKLKKDRISPSAWQKGMDELYGSVDLEVLRQAIDFDRLKETIVFEEGRGEEFVMAPFSGIEGMETQAVITKLARVKKGRSIYPHGHQNMVSAFLTLEGSFHVRQFEKRRESEEAMWVEKVQDETSRPGQWSSISDEKTNVHWLTAKAEETYLFSTKLIRLDPDKPLKGRIPIDVRGADGGVFKAPKISFAKAHELYG